jgi:hypothetical protein
VVIHPDVRLELDPAGAVWFLRRSDHLAVPDDLERADREDALGPG